jgi:aerotaxis receptor
MQGVTRASQRVSEISALIDSIAFQTNLLALNAAVEAARAGEHGKGFAVVAAEVRALSQKSAQAARDIKAVVDESQNQVLTGFRVAEQAGGTMRGVVASMQGLAGLVQDIRLASQEQAAGMEQINQAVGQLEQMTQQNAELVRQGVQLTETLALQAARLDEAASVFQG